VYFLPELSEKKVVTVPLNIQRTTVEAKTEHQRLQGGLKDSYKFRQKTMDFYAGGSTQQ
jgi:hypothetical protein